MAKNFKDLMHDVTPLKQKRFRGHTIKKKNQPVPVLPQTKIPETPVLDYMLEYSLGGADIISFSKSGIAWKQMQRLKQGPCQDASLDLHRQTVAEAKERVDHFIEHAMKKGQRWVRIIHGKGSFSVDNKPVLKNFLNRYLREHPYVLAFHTAPPQKGGGGVLHVLIKKIAP